MQTSAAHADYAERIAFVAELAERLHTYGTTAQRLEGAIDAVAQKLGLECEPWSNPTGIILSFSDPARPAGESDTTRLIRLAPGDNDLSKLCKADRIAEEVMAGRMDVASGHAALRQLDYPPRMRALAMQVLGFGLAAAGMAGLLQLPWLDIATAGVTGLLIGLLQPFTGLRPQLREAADAVAGLIAGTVAVLVAAYVGPLNLNTVIIVSLIVLLPGMSLTNAVNELTSQHLVSGTARFAGALATVLKLAVGTMIALTVADLLGVEPQVRALRPQPEWLGWVALPFILAVSFWANFQLTSANYIEHYGLLRQKLANGRYEVCQPHHSWNSNHLLSNWAVFHLQRHSDHHAHPTRRYQSLRDFPQAPQLPNGYFGMFVIAYVPALWFKVMDKRVIAACNGDPRRINFEPAKRSRLMAKFNLNEPAAEVAA